MLSETVHQESLLHIPLVSQLIDDPSVRIAIRGVDSWWTYAGVVDRRVDGFNPFQGVVFAGRHSHLAEWLPHRRGSARKFNHDDRLVNEVLFAVHDYLHVWAYRWIARLWPELGFGYAQIGPDNFEDMVFCHLLSEAAATVGLDYWYLSCENLNKAAPIGTAKKGLTVSYREDLLGEYRMFCPGLEIQHSSFFETIANFYCTGSFPGFSAEDMQLSPSLRGWLVHELEYGKLQRQYCREWFSYLSGGRIRLSPSRLGRALSDASPKHEALMRELGALLWAKVKNGDTADSGFRFDPDRVWSAGAPREMRFQFLNLNQVGLPNTRRLAKISGRSATFLIHQYIAQLDYGAFPKDGMPFFDLVYRRGDLALAESLLRGFQRVERGECEPRDIFLYN
jgi:hypothetical protein